MDRYDRQLRLWGLDGQKRLQAASICILTPQYHSPLVEEVLKNVLLLGMSKFTIVTKDRAGIDNDDAPGFPFFTEDALFGPDGLNGGGASRTVLSWEVAKASVQWASFSLLLLLDMKEEESILIELVNLSKTGCGFPPILTVLSGARYSYYHLKLNEPHFVVDLHPDHTIPALRLNRPWTELQSFVDSFNLAEEESEQFSKIPYPIIILKALQSCSSEPRNARDVKEKIDAYLSSIGLTSNTDLNVIEAKRFAHLALGTVDHSTQKIMNLLARCKQIESLPSSSDSWNEPLNQQIYFLLQCLEVYIGRFGCVPLSGEFPDMESVSAYYSGLKSIYETKKAYDYSNFRELVSSYDTVKIPEMVLEAFCSNLGNLDCLMPTSEMGLKSVHSDFSRNSASKNGSLGWLSHPSIPFIAGLVSQEIIKIITHQYLPINNTLKYDIMNNDCAVYIT